MHRKHASVYDVATLLPHYCGDLVRDELAVLSRLTGDPERPYAVVLGGSKVSDKLAVIESLLPKVDRLLVGGGMCFTFLAAQGHGVGDSLLEPDQIDNCRRLLDEAGRQDRAAHRHRRRAGHRRRRADRRRCPPTEIPGGGKGLDIGPESVHGLRRGARRRADGVLERPDGCVRGGAVRGGHPRASPRPSPRRPGLSVVGGGDSAAAVRALGLDESSLRAHLHRRRARRWSTSRARSCPVSPFWKRADVARSKGPLPPVEGRRPLIAGNWKMNYNHLEAIALVQKLIFSLNEEQLHRVEVAVLPPFIDIRSVQTLIDGDQVPIRYGAQDLSPHDSGAYTGDVSGPMLAKLGCTLRRRRPLRAARVPRRGRRGGQQPR